MAPGKLLSKLTLIVMAAAAASIAPARAQGFELDEPRASNNGPVVKTQVQNGLKRGYTYRVTTGSHSSAGWEKSLTDGDPNLRHWTWMPVTNYDQGYVRVAPGMDASGKPLVKKPSGGIYVKPAKVALPQRQYHFENTAPSRSTSEVSASVKFARTPASRAYEGPAQTYSYGEVACKLRAHDVAAMSEQKDVYGRLVSGSGGPH